MSRQDLPEDMPDVKAVHEFMVREGLRELVIKGPQGELVMKRRGAAPVAQAAPAAVQAAAARSVQTVKAPLMGVFYRAPSPGAPPFVEEGSLAERGQTLCIIEAMKMMNEIKADQRCRVAAILAENGLPVKSGQDLFEIESA